MKHVHESLNQYYDYQFFKVFEEEDEKADLKNREKDGLAIIEKIKKNFEEFKKGAKGEILKYKEFWEENKKNKEGYTETGDVYKMFDSNYVVGVLELPVETLSDGSIDGGMPATDEPETEIIEGPELDSQEEKPEGETEFFEEQQVPNAENATNEAEEGDDIDLDLELPDEEGEEDLPQETDVAGEEESGEEMPTDDLDLGTDEPEEEMPADDTEAMDDLDNSAEETSDEESTELTAPGTYFVVYDISGDQREEIFRCGSNNVVNAFKAFYNDTFKGSMKAAILSYKEKKAQEKIEAEKSEKKKAESAKDSKVKKFLGEDLRYNVPYQGFGEEPDEYGDDDAEDEGYGEFTDEDFSNYENEFAIEIVRYLEHEGIEYDDDLLADAIDERLEDIRQFMEDGVSPSDCAGDFMLDEDFLNDIII